MQDHYRAFESHVISLERAFDVLDLTFGIQDGLAVESDSRVLRKIITDIANREGLTLATEAGILSGVSGFINSIINVILAILKKIIDFIGYILSGGRSKNKEEKFKRIKTLITSMGSYSESEFRNALKDAYFETPGVLLRLPKEDRDLNDKELIKHLAKSFDGLKELRGLFDEFGKFRDEINDFSLGEVVYKTRGVIFSSIDKDVPVSIDDFKNLKDALDHYTASSQKLAKVRFAKSEVIDEDVQSDMTITNKNTSSKLRTVRGATPIVIGTDLVYKRSGSDETFTLITRAFASELEPSSGYGSTYKFTMSKLTIDDFDFFNKVIGESMGLAKTFLSKLKESRFKLAQKNMEDLAKKISELNKYYEEKTSSSKELVVHNENHRGSMKSRDSVESIKHVFRQVQKELALCLRVNASFLQLEGSLFYLLDAHENQLIDFTRHVMHEIVSKMPKKK